ncbi:MAG: LexA family transcriptional regulator [Campylobacterales bacterium]|nr:LexA family transcriptional regulator [Campylobacterales bacterium]
MLEFKSIINKLKIVLSKNIEKNGKIFDKDVATALGIPQATFATMKSRNSLPYEEILSFCAKYKISINWLFFDQDTQMLLEQTNKFVQVRYFPNIQASAGGGALNFEEDYTTLDVDKNLIEKILPSNKIYEAINIEGDSMEPTLRDGSVVFIDRSVQDIGKDGIFIAATTAGLFVKRIRKRMDGNIELISDNQAYSPEILTPDEVQIVGKVVGTVESL